MLDNSESRLGPLRALRPHNASDLVAARLGPISDRSVA